jgi:hypothetical protein
MTVNHTFVNLDHIVYDGVLPPNGDFYGGEFYFDVTPGGNSPPGTVGEALVIVGN